MKYSGGYNKENVIAIFASLIVSLIFLIASPLHPWIGGVASPDSCVFKTVALMMKLGYMPYKDSFDHKGPLIYLLNYIGNEISYYRGIWVIEVLFLAVAVYFLYKTSRLACGRFSAIIAVLLSMSLLFDYFEGGNLTEEYAMPFISISTFIFADYFLNDRISAFRIIMSGLGFGAVIMLRPNMIAIWLVFCGYIFIKKIVLREFRELFGFIGLFAVGTAIIVLPILIWLLVKNDLGYFWRDYIVFNKLYSSPEGGRALFSAKWSAFIEFIKTTVYISSFVALAYHVRKKERVFNVIYMLYIIVMVFMMVLSGQSYAHYGMIIVPAVVYPLSLIFADIKKIKEESVRKILFMLVVMYSLANVIAPKWFNLIGIIPATYEARNEKDLYKDDNFVELISLIQEKTDEDDAISVYGSWDIVYVVSERKHATRYSYQAPIGQIMPEIMEEYYMQLQKELPKIIVIQSGRYDAGIDDFIAKNDYKLLWTSDSVDKPAMMYIR